MSKLLTIIFLAIACSSCSSGKLTAQPVRNLRVFALDGKSLERNKGILTNGQETLAPAYKQLLKDADKALKFGPVSVMEKTNTPPSGDKHDYMSLAPYFWPNPDTKDGLPYIRKDGQTNPEVKEYKDKDYLPKLCEYVNTLGLAYYFSENTAYAAHAANLLKVWFINPESRMNPNLNFGQAIKGKNDGRGAGMIDTRHFVKLIDGIGFLKGSKYWKADDQKAMQAWFTEFLTWMQTSPIGTDELKAKNNHGAWYDAQRLSMALFIDSADLAKRVVQSAANRLDYQVDEQGMFPAEMERTISLHYTAFAMEAFFNIAQMSAYTNIDFWKLITPSGKSLEKSFKVLKPYLANEVSWTGQQIKDYDFEDSYLLLEQGAKHFGCKDCVLLLQNLAADKAPRLKMNLIF
ncbi:MAG: alginate lyase family protein [Ferruginibacter sp.]